MHQRPWISTIPIFQEASRCQDQDIPLVPIIPSLRKPSRTPENAHELGRSRVSSRQSNLGKICDYSSIRQDIREFIPLYSDFNSSTSQWRSSYVGPSCSIPVSWARRIRWCSTARCVDTGPSWIDPSRVDPGWYNYRVRSQWYWDCACTGTDWYYNTSRCRCLCWCRCGCSPADIAEARNVEGKAVGEERVRDTLSRDYQ